MAGQGVARVLCISTGLYFPPLLKTLISIQSCELNKIKTNVKPKLCKGKLGVVPLLTGQEGGRARHVVELDSKVT